MKDYVVAIDLGTSRSAWAFCIEGKAESAIMLRVPKGNPQGEYCKTETAVLLRADNHEVSAFGNAASERFVQEAEDAEGPHDELDPTSPAPGLLFRWFKRELCKNGGYQKCEDPVATAEGGQTLPLLSVMSAVLRFFKEDALDHMAPAVHTDLSVSDIAWAITIPAIYDDFAKRFMRVAAHEAGIIDHVDSPRLRLCLEPEAACLAVNMKEAPELLLAGMKTMIVDCGGGTVDITTHEILSLDPLDLHELHSPDGGAWGSACVDDEFKAWFKQYIGGDRYARIRKKPTFYKILMAWEGEKLKFGTNGRKLVRINMTGLRDELPELNVQQIQDMRSNYNKLHEDAGFHVTGNKYIVKLPAPLVRSFFKSTIDNISNCLVNLKNHKSLRGLKYVFLVGGFSASPLIQSAARTSLEGDGVTVISSLKPDVAIVKGAVLFANNEEAFSMRKARLTYGVKTSVLYNPDDDPEHEGRLPTMESGFARIARFHRHLKKGDDICAHGVCPTHSYSPGNSTQSTVTVEILGSHRKDIKFVDDTSFRLGELTVPLDMDASFSNRAIKVQFVFGRTEFSVNCFRVATGEKVGETSLDIAQEVVHS